MQSSGTFGRQTARPVNTAAPVKANSARSTIRMASRPVFRTLVLQFHRWTELTVGIVLVFMALTGALIAYRPHLEPVVNRDLLTVPACSERVSLDLVAASARVAHPAGELDYIRILPAAEGAARIPACGSDPVNFYVAWH